MLRELKKESISKDLSDSLLEIGDQALKLSLTEVTSENSSVIAKTDMSLDDEQRHVVAAWLTTKEASNLLADVIVVFDRVDRANQVVELLIHTLLNARHQGAVSKAAEALETVSTYLMSTSSQSCCRELPSKWLDKMFEYLNAQDTNPKLRRSSGFGAAVRALVRSCSEMCRRCFDTLIRTSGAETNPILVRVHALNLLNTLLRDTRVFVSQDHLSKLFQISVVGFEHNTWALRNSSLLVYVESQYMHENAHTHTYCISNIFLQVLCCNGENVQRSYAWCHSREYVHGTISWSLVFSCGTIEITSARRKKEAYVHNALVATHVESRTRQR